jgi:prolyl oligopeptidase
VRDSLANRVGLEDEIRSRMPGFVGAPSKKGDRLFFMRRNPDEEHAVLVMQEPNGDERVILDPAALDPTGLTTLGGISVSPEGNRLAYFTANSGTELTALNVVDIDSGLRLEDPIPAGRGGTLSWLPGGDRYVYVRRLGDADLPDEPEAEQFYRRVYLHTVGTDPSTDVQLAGDGRDKRTYYGVSASRDGKWLTVSASLGTDPRNDLYLFDLTSPTPTPVTIIEGVDAGTSGGVRSDDGQLYLSTDLNASNGRIVRVDPRNPQPEHWVDLIPETDQPITSYCLTTEHVLVARSQDVVSQISLHDRSSGAKVRDVALPGAGDANVSSWPNSDEVFIGYTDMTTPSMVMRYNLAADTSTVWRTPPGMPDLSGLATTPILVESTDGRQVPVFLAHRADVELDGTNPTILYGYGGFNNAMSPYYSASISTWVKAGGVYAIAGIRGGSEYGEEWHRQGMLSNKQQVFDDFYAVAEQLISDGWTSTPHLGISGGSNGGLLVGVALAQRPDLFTSVVCSAPLLDMIRYDRFGLGRTWVGEYGRPEVPTEFGWLRRYSPLHNVVEGSHYPSVLFTVFDNDTRVDPLHARKLCAELQWATANSAEQAPILLRREANVGHSDRSVSLSLRLSADTLAWQADRLGLDLSLARAASRTAVVESASPASPPAAPNAASAPTDALPLNLPRLDQADEADLGI